MARGLRSLRESWEAGASPSVVVAAISQWLQTVSLLYTREPTRWDYFLADYTRDYDDPEGVARLRHEFRHALTEGVVINPAQLLDTLSDALDWFFRDLRDHESVRHNVFISWCVFRREREASAVKTAARSLAVDPRPAV